MSDAVSSQLKTVLGKLAYLIGGAQVLMDYTPIATRVSQSQPAADRGAAAADRDVELLAFAVCNSRLIGGGRLIAPHAVIDDGWLDVCLIHAMPTLEFVALLRRVSSGEHVEDDRVTYFRTQALELTFDSRHPPQHRRAGARGRSLPLRGPARRGPRPAACSPRPPSAVRRAPRRRQRSSMIP